MTPLKRSTIPLNLAITGLLVEKEPAPEKKFKVQSLKFKVSR
jgi:hypothetical protein